MRPSSFFLTIVLRVAFLVGCLIATSSASAQLLEIDRTALIALYNATDGEHWTNNAGWLSDSPIDTWHGVVVSSSWGGDRVTTLHLSGNNLRGEIPVELTRLSYLEHLDLSDNALTGRISVSRPKMTFRRGSTHAMTCAAQDARSPLMNTKSSAIVILLWPNAI